MTKRKRPKEPSGGPVIPSPHDRADLPQGMNPNSGVNSQLSQRERWKIKLANFRSWLRAHLARIGCIITFVGFLFSIHVYFESSRQYEASKAESRRQHMVTISKIDNYYKETISKNKEDISYLNNKIQEQNKWIEKQRQEGKLPPDLMPPRDTPRNGASVSKGSINVTPVGNAAKQFIVTGKLDRVPEGKGWWIGTLSGLRFWPQIELPPNIGEGQPFRFRVTMPPNIASGEVVLMEAGSEANQLFKRQRVGKYYEVGLFRPHLKDARVIDSKNFP